MFKERFSQNRQNLKTSLLSDWVNEAKILNTHIYLISSFEYASPM